MLQVHLYIYHFRFQVLTINRNKQLCLYLNAILTKNIAWPCS
jgi:hypothetical protein